MDKSLKTHPSHAPPDEVSKGGSLVGAALSGLDCLAETKPGRGGGAWWRFFLKIEIFFFRTHPPPCCAIGSLLREGGDQGRTRETFLFLRKCTAVFDFRNSV